MLSVLSPAFVVLLSLGAGVSSSGAGSPSEVEAAPPASGESSPVEHAPSPSEADAIPPVADEPAPAEPAAPPSEAENPASGEPEAAAPVSDSAEAASAEPVPDEPQTSPQSNPYSGLDSASVFAVTEPGSSKSDPDPEHPEPTLADPARRGPLIGLSLGYVGCGTDACNFGNSGGGWRFRGGAMGQLELGYRIGRLSPMVSFDFGGGPMQYFGDGAELIEGSFRFLDFGAGMMVFPIARSRVDPFLGLRFGYSRARHELAVPEADFELDNVYSRFGFRPSAGLAFYLHPRVALGPRFDMTLPVAGGLCSKTREGEQTLTQCIDASSFSDAGRAELPRWWSLMLGVNVVLPRRQR